MNFYEKLSPGRREEYRARVEKIKKSNPDVSFPSEYHNKMLNINLAGIDEMKDFIRVLPIISRLLGSTAAKKEYAGHALAHAAAIGNLALCQKLCTEAHAALDMKDEKGHTPLMNAVKRKRLGAAEYLLQKGAKILTPSDGWNPVLEACAMGCIPALNMFKHYGVDFNQTYVCWKKEGKFKFPKKEFLSPIMVACAFKQPKAVQFLLDNGVNMNSPCVENGTLGDLIMLTPQIFDPEIRKILQSKTQEMVCITPKHKTCSIPFQQIRDTQR